MKKYILKTKNLNDSLVFYRTLFNRMPDELTGWQMSFRLPTFQLVVQEEVDPMIAPNVLEFEISDSDQLSDVYDRMSRFMAIAKFNDDCEVLDDAFGLIDPDGNRWIIGNPEADVHFEKCYFNNKLLNK